MCIVHVHVQVVESGEGWGETLGALWAARCCEVSSCATAALPLPPSPPPPDEDECPGSVTLEVQGWQMISFNSVSSSFDLDVLKTVTFGVDDKIITRDAGQLLIATYDGEKWQGALVAQGLSYARGYAVFFSGSAGSEIKQSGEPRNWSVERELVVLSKGWNWIGHAPCADIDVNSITTIVGKFNADDQIKTRAGFLALTTYTGSQFEGELKSLVPGVGYEIKVNEPVTFKY